MGTLAEWAEETAAKAHLEVGLVAARRECRNRRNPCRWHSSCSWLQGRRRRSCRRWRIRTCFGISAPADAAVVEEENPRPSCSF